jgi:hypothetical protein
MSKAVKDGHWPRPAHVLDDHLKITLWVSLLLQSVFLTAGCGAGEAGGGPDQPALHATSAVMNPVHEGGAADAVVLVQLAQNVKRQRGGR